MESTSGRINLERFNPENLSFRAACNGVAPTASQPVKDRILRSIHNSKDARATIGRLLHANNVPDEDSLVKLLANDLCWKTLVTEHIAKDARWKDLFANSKSVSEWTKSFFDKLWDGTNHPASKAASAIVMSLAGIAATKQFDPHLLSIPVTPVLSPDAKGNPVLPLSFTTDAASEPLRVQFQLPTGSTVPVDLQLKTSGEPIDFRLAKGNDPSPTIQYLTTQLAATNRSIMAASTDLHTLSNRPLIVDTKDLNSSIGGVSSNLANVSTLLNDLNRRVDALSAAEVQRSKQLDKSVEEGIDASRFRVITLQLHQGVPQSVVLPYLKWGSGVILTKTVKLTVSMIGKDANGPFVRLTCIGENCPPHINLYEGASEMLINDPIYKIGLTTTSRRWFISKIAEITLTPQASDRALLSVSGPTAFPK